jgi:hypothetical protein
MQYSFSSFLSSSPLVPSFLKPKSLIDENSADFIFSTTAWVLQNFDHVEFFKRTRLIAPSNDFFPGRVSSVEEKAKNIFNHTLTYTGLAHWPLELKPLHKRKHNSDYQLPPSPEDSLASIQRDSSSKASTANNAAKADQPLYVFYDPQQTLKPEDLSASYAHVMAQHMIIQSGLQPAGGPQIFTEVSEILASMMGFGVLLANSAYTFRGGCGSCYNAMANRQPALTELDSVFVLALFCRLKGITDKEATRYLKKYLRSSYKRALRQIDERIGEVNGLKRLISV